MVKPIIPRHYKTKGVKNIDIVIFIYATYNSNDRVIAASGACSLSRKEKNRPVVGSFYFNMYFFNNDRNPSIFQTVIHELTHIFAFSNLLYGYYVDKNGNSLGKDNVYINKGKFYEFILPKVVNYARKYFNCNKITGVRLEDNGGAGSASSHWEKSILNGEVMNPSATYDEVLSPFTLNLYDSTGWYKVDHSIAGYLDYGRNAGCGFQEKLCNISKQIPEFCQGFYMQKCTIDYKYMGICMKNSFSDRCPMIVEFSNEDCRNSNHKNTLYSNYGNVYGPNSRCFSSDIINVNKKKIPWRKQNSLRCFESYCFRTKKENKFYIKIVTPSENLYCYKSHSWVSVNKGNYNEYVGMVKCPDIEKFCKFHNSECKNSCYGRGKCVNGKCNCHFLYDGDDCSINIGNFSKNINIEFEKSQENNKSYGLNIIYASIGIFIALVVAFTVIYKLTL